MGTGKIASGDGQFVHLPFAGITLFRFNGCNLSLSVSEKHPGITVINLTVLSAKLRREMVISCNVL